MNKKILSIITILIMFLLIFVGNVYAGNTKIGQQLSIYGILGDMNLDRKITSSDSSLLNKHVKNKTYLAPFAKKRADVNQDGKIDSTDVTKLNNYLKTLENQVSKITDITISGPTTLKPGQLIKLTATPVPDNIQNVKVSWSSSNITKAILLGNGNILGIGYGDVTIKVKIGDFEKSYNLQVKNDEIGKIAIESPPNKLEYNIGEKISKSGLKIITTSKDGKTEKTVMDTTKFTLTPDTVAKAGEQKIKVTYQGKSASFTITAGSLERVDGIYIDTANSIPDTMENTKNYWKVKIQNSTLQDDIHLGKKTFKNYNSQSIALFYANRILGADINESELDIYFNKDKNTAYWSKGNFEYNAEYGSFENQLKTIYDELIKGYPVLVKVKDEDCNTKYVVAYGVTKTNKSITKLSAIDFQTIDPSDGDRKTLSEFYQYTENGSPIYALVTFNEEAVKSIAIQGATSVAQNLTTQLNAIVKNTGGVEIKIPKLNKVTWSISKNSTNATISNEGLVTAGSKLGSPKVTVISELNNSIKKQCTITICKPYGGTEIARKSSDDPKIIKFFKSNINSKTYTIIDQIATGLGWEGCCNRATALCIASSMGNATLDKLISKTSCQPFDKDSYGNTYFSNFGLKNLGTNFKNDYQSAVKEYVKKGDSIALYFGSSTKKTNNSTNAWATDAHWIAIIGYDVVDGVEKMYVADSGHSNSGWYPINEFRDIQNIKYVFVIQEK